MTDKSIFWLFDVCVLASSFRNIMQFPLAQEVRISFVCVAVEQLSFIHPVLLVNQNRYNSETVVPCVF